jgi:hypothetical protein
VADVSVSLDLDAQQLYQELQNVQSHFASFASRATEAGEKAGKGFSSGFSLGTAGQNLLTGLAGLGLGAEIKGIVEYGAKIEDLSRRFGVGTETLQRFGNAAELNGSSLEAVARGFRFLEVNQAKALGGSEAMVKAFAELGVSIEDLRSLRPEDIAEKIGHSSLNAADFVKIFGKSAIELRPLLAGIADGTIQLGNAIKDLDIKNLKEADDQLKSIGQTLRTFSAGLLSESFAGLKEAFTLGGPEHEAAIKENAKRREEALLRTRYLANPPPAATVGRDFSHPAEGDSESGETDDQGRQFGGGGKAKESLKDQIADLQAKAQGEAVLARKKILDEFAKDSEDVRDRLASGDYSSFTSRSKDRDLLSDLEKRRDLKLAEVDKKDAEQAERDREKEVREAEREKDKAAKDAERDRRKSQEDELRRRQSAERIAAHDQERALNPAGLSLEDYAKANIIGSPAIGQAQQAIREQELSKRLQLGGDLTGAAEHHNRAEEIKRSLGLPNDIDKEKSFLDAIEKAEVFKKIERNTQGIGVNL